MNVAQICQTNAVTVRALEELIVAAKLMREKHIGYLVVVEPGLVDGTLRPEGVITDRDIVVAVVARDQDPHTLTVGDVMTREPLVVREDDPVNEALHQMRRIGVRRVPVVGSRGELFGVLSLDDILTGIAAELDSVAAAIRSEQVIEQALRP